MEQVDDRLRPRTRVGDSGRSFGNAEGVRPRAARAGGGGAVSPLRADLAYLRRSARGRGVARHAAGLVGARVAARDRDRHGCGVVALARSHATGRACRPAARGRREPRDGARVRAARPPLAALYELSFQVPPSFFRVVEPPPRNGPRLPALLLMSLSATVAVSPLTVAFFTFAVSRP